MIILFSMINNTNIVIIVIIIIIVSNYFELKHSFSSNDSKNIDFVVLVKHSRTKIIKLL